MKIISIEFTPSWSWGLTFAAIAARTGLRFSRVFVNQGDQFLTGEYDIVLSQNVTLLKKFTERVRTVCRLGGNQNFDRISGLSPLLAEMAKCHALIATNQKLYLIAKAVNENTFLIPNGLDLDVWSPVPSDPDRPFTVGFCGNISTPQYREYKGFDLVETACRQLGVNLKTALYKNGQIPHDRMREDFYAQIDCLVHPTLGEGCSNTLMEACACGVPIITTREAGFHGEKMIDHDNVLFCDRSITSIVAALQEIKDYDLRRKLSDGSRAFALEHHDIRTIAMEYEKIFQSCIAVPRPSTVKIMREFAGLQYLTVIFRRPGKKVEQRIFPLNTDSEIIKQELEKCP